MDSSTSSETGPMPPSTGPTPSTLELEMREVPLAASGSTVLELEMREAPFATSGSMAEREVDVESGAASAAFTMMCGNWNTANTKGAANSAIMESCHQWRDQPLRQVKLGYGGIADPKNGKQRQLTSGSGGIVCFCCCAEGDSSGASSSIASMSSMESSTNSEKGSMPPSTGPTPSTLELEMREAPFAASGSTALELEMREAPAATLGSMAEREVDVESGAVSAAFTKMGGNWSTANTKGAVNSAIMESRNQWREGAAGFGAWPRASASAAGCVGLQGIADPKNGKLRAERRAGSNT
eukprot:CAMPEP_0172929370 /NCGR_PEP_ID=MMETSP1075-20121228/218448_1 /TAXON_ID=2916 /ORGANISM="Ceratium fusus, Strain PA161109" /LENGTH=296 /DNA_ID=CAMNT_0013790663 /DNA_START=48 /DNA_END=933 /DNA_ORIENTATION=-